MYDSLTDDIKWELIGTGLAYKTGNIQFYDNWIYASKDSRPGGVIKVKYVDARDRSKQIKNLETPNDCLSVYIGSHGDLLAIMTTTGGEYDPSCVFYSRDRVSFTEIALPILDNLTRYGYSIFYNTWGVTEKGDILSGIRTRNKSPLSEWVFSPSIWLSEELRRAGFRDAFQ